MYNISENKRFCESFLFMSEVKQMQMLSLKKV